MYISITMISIIGKQYANDLAAGNINMHNGNKQNSFPWLQMVSCIYHIRVFGKCDGNATARSKPVRLDWIEVVLTLSDCLAFRSQRSLHWFTVAASTSE